MAAVKSEKYLAYGRQKSYVALVAAVCSHKNCRRRARVRHFVGRLSIDNVRCSLLLMPYHRLSGRRRLVSVFVDGGGDDEVRRRRCGLTSLAPLRFLSDFSRSLGILLKLIDNNVTACT